MTDRAPVEAELAMTRHALRRKCDRVAELEAQAKDTETHTIMADYKRDELRAALREIGETVGASLSVDASHEFHTSVVDEVRAVVTKLRSRAAEFSAFVSHEYAEALSARNSALSRLWDSQRLKDNYSGELKVVIGERDASKSLLADAQIYVREVARENAAGWGGRLMHKQKPAIDCDAAITAFLEGE